MAETRARDTADINKTVTDGLALKANIASPTFTGTPAAPTAAAGTNTTQLATTEFVQSAGGLMLLSATSFSAVNEVIVNNVFISTYVNYRMIFTAAGSTTADVSFQFRSGGSTLSGANYRYGSSAHTTSNGAASFGATGQTSIPIQGIVSGLFLSTTMDIIAPRNASGIQMNYQGPANTGTSFVMRNVIGQYYSGEVADGVRISAGAGTMGGTLRIYGYRN